MSRRLHIGGQVQADGGEVLDVNPGPHVDHVRNAGDMLCFADATFSEIYASHVVEHFDYKNELLATLKEWQRVMVPGGMLYVSVPDLDALARLYLDRERLSFEDRILVMRMIFGGHIDRNDYHLVGFNEELLTDFLGAAGFKQMRKIDRLGLFNDTSSQTLKGVLISLNMVCVKPF